MRRRVLPLLVLFLAACGEAPAPVIGVIVSGNPGHAARIAIADSGGVALVVRPSPDPVDAEVAIHMATSLVEEPGVLAVIGHSNSAASLAAARIYNEARVVQIAPTSTAPLYDEAGPFSYRMVPSDTLQGRFLAAAVRERWPGAQRVAIIYVNDDYGRGLYRQVRSQLQNVSYDAIYSDVADSANIVHLGSQLTAIRPDLLLWLGRPRRLRQILQPLREAVPGIAVLCSDACDEATVHENAARDYNGLTFVRFTDPESTDPRMQQFQREYRARTGESASSEAVLAHDAAAVIAAAIEQGARSGEDVRRYLDRLGRSLPPFEGIAGPVAFDAAGTALRAYYLANIDSAGSLASVPLGAQPRDRVR